MKTVKSVLDFSSGAIVERLNLELKTVIDNINDPNTDDKPRRLTIEMAITPINGRSSLALKTTIKKKLSPTNAVHTQMALSQIQGRLGIAEMSGIPDGQSNLFGEVYEQPVVFIEEKI